jgi:hypothetical protein
MVALAARLMRLTLEQLRDAATVPYFPLYLGRKVIRWRCRSPLLLEGSCPEVLQVAQVIVKSWRRWAGEAKTGCASV